LSGTVKVYGQLGAISEDIGTFCCTGVVYESTLEYILTIYNKKTLENFEKVPF
jgi:hypothetical protein